MSATPSGTSSPHAAAGAMWPAHQEERSVLHHRKHAAKSIYKGVSCHKYGISLTQAQIPETSGKLTAHFHALLRNECFDDFPL
jgi:hypothetical protein